MGNNQYTKAYELGMKAGNAGCDCCPYYIGYAESDWWWQGWGAGVAARKPEDLKKGKKNERKASKQVTRRY